MTQDRNALIQAIKAGQLAEQLRIEERCKTDGLWWACNYTKTYNEQAAAQGRQPNEPFPDLRYFHYLWRAMDQSRRLFIPKSREMMTSWLVAAWCTHFVQFNPGSQVLTQTQTEQKVKRLVSYSKCLYDRQPEWMRKRYPLKGGVLSSDDMSQTQLEQTWDHGGSFIGVPSGERQVASYHPTVVVFDEAAHLEGVRGAYNIASPVAPKIICISSAGPGWFQEECSEDNLDPDGEAGILEMFAGI